MMDVIAAHRRALADALDQLSAEQWHGRSLCEGWTPAHVLAHQTMPFRISGPEFMAGLQRCHGDFTAFSDEIAERDSKLPASELVTVLRDNADNPWSPPGGSLSSALSHDVIHGLDIGWPLALDYEIPAAALTAVLGSMTTPLTLPDDAPRAAEVHVSDTADGTDGSDERETGRPRQNPFGLDLDGLTVTATDLGWSAGTGPELAGQSRDLILLLAGRSIPANRFSGPADRFARPAAW